jgi:hypothetical protein
MNPKLTASIENIESQIMADLLRPLSPAEIERLTVDAIVTHRRLIDEADRLYQAVPDPVASASISGNEQYVAYVKASLDMHAQMEVLDTLIKALGFLPSVTMN